MVMYALFGDRNVDFRFKLVKMVLEWLYMCYVVDNNVYFRFKLVNMVLEWLHICYVGYILGLSW